MLYSVDSSTKQVELNAHDKRLALPSLPFAQGKRSQHVDYQDGWEYLGGINQGDKCSLGKGHCDLLLVEHKPMVPRKCVFLPCDLLQRVVENAMKEAKHFQALYND